MAETAETGKKQARRGAPQRVADRQCMALSIAREDKALFLELGGAKWLRDQLQKIRTQQQV